MTMKLFALISNGGDGSYSTNYTFNQSFIDRLETAYNDGKMDYENGLGVDGDGFHYDTLTVPDECTLASLSIHYDAADTYEYILTDA